LKIKCPGCDLEVDELDLKAQVEHMNKVHPKIVEERLKKS